MKRDFDLLRWLLMKVESCEGGYPVVLTRGIYNSACHQLVIEEEKFAEVCEHVLLLGDANLAEVRELGRSFAGLEGVAIDRLTMNGHDFLDAARDENRWSKAMKIVNEKGGGAVTIGVLVQILSAIVKQSFGFP
jgi:Hypothetical protein (DUF2513)